MSPAQPSHDASEPSQFLTPQRRVPGATYRLQFHPQFTLRDAAAQLAYLKALGITDCYASPWFQPRPGSQHGYDVCNYNQLNPELGAPADLDAFCQTLRSLHLGLLLDIVPNHMGVGDPANLWWTDLLQHGSQSHYAAFFDVEWNPPTPSLKNKILLPILGEPYGRTLEKGQLQLILLNGNFLLDYYQKHFPLAPPTWTFLLNNIFQDLSASASPAEPERQQLLQALQAWSASRQTHDLLPIQTRLRDWEQTFPSFRKAAAQTLARLNGTPGRPASFNTLDALLRDQHYRLAFWRVGPAELNYRRFFDITDLAGVRVEDPAVFGATHALLLQWLAEGKVTGLRVDHPDGLWDPAGYFLRLQTHYLAQVIARSPGAQAPDKTPLQQAEEQLHRSARSTGQPRPHPPLYVVAEKILSEAEPLPADWWVDGTTGYDFLNQVNGLFVDTANADAFDRIYRAFTGRQDDYHQTMLRAKRAVLEHSLVSESQSLSQRLHALAAQNRQSRDFSRSQLHAALCEIITTLPVYRTYLNGPDDLPSPQDRACVTRAVQEAQQRNPQLPHDLFLFLQNLLLLDHAAAFDHTGRAELLHFVMKVQQLTGPAMAKGAEDTAFYLHNRLLSLNEVGGHPDRFGLSADAFHAHNIDRLQHWPHALLASATHDTKRGEDVRARLNVLSEIPQAWQQALQRWSQLNATAKTMVDGNPAPSPNDEYLLYQTLIGAWPLPQSNDDHPSQFLERIQAYLRKAAKEAKTHTSWIDPNPAYEEALDRFAQRLLHNPSDNPFLQDFLPLQQRVAWLGHFNSLAQTLLKMTAPGVPDFFQGTELWELSLVDPDNRRPVDFSARQEMLRHLEQRFAQAQGQPQHLLRTLGDHWESGALKLYTIWRTLHFRKDHPDLFRHGTYVPIRPQGAKNRHLCAFLRAQDQQAILVVVPRLLAGLIDNPPRQPLGREIWQDSFLELPPEHSGATWHNLLTGETLPTPAGKSSPRLEAAAVLARFPVALLERIA